jgi:hypothetical protein
MGETMTYNVTIRATITKTIQVEAESPDEADNLAQEEFSPEVDDSDENFEQETINIKEAE